MSTANSSFAVNVVSRIENYIATYKIVVIVGFVIFDFLHKQYFNSLFLTLDTLLFKNNIYNTKTLVTTQNKCIDV